LTTDAQLYEKITFADSLQWVNDLEGQSYQGLGLDIAHTRAKI